MSVTDTSALAIVACRCRHSTSGFQGIEIWGIAAVAHGLVGQMSRE